MLLGCVPIAQISTSQASNQLQLAPSNFFVVLPPSGSKCGVLDPGAKECAFCTKKKKNHKQRGEVCRRSQQALQECGFQEFWQDCDEELKKFWMHISQVRSNCKKLAAGVRRQAVNAGIVVIQHDCTEALKIERQKEVQSMNFGGNVSVSIEGCTCHFPRPDDETKILFDFNSFLSGDLQQKFFHS